MATSFAGPWPELTLAAWRPTRDTLHLWTQVIGKSLLAGPVQNHWWHSALEVSARGLATKAPVLLGDRSVEIELDLVAHALTVRTDERAITTPLVARTVRSFHQEYLALLRAVGVDVHVWTTPVEIPDPIPFEQDEVHCAYDPEAANRFFQVLRRCDAALRGLSYDFVGKQSPVHFFWGSFDLAATRFSGRRAPERPGADRVTREAYSHEAISCGFWPGGALIGGGTFDEPIFYAYAAPEPPGFRGAAIQPVQARYDERLAEFVLPYEAVRTADDPTVLVRAFCETVYEAGATLGRWEREALERWPPRAEAPAVGAVEAGLPAGA